MSSKPVPTWMDLNYTMSMCSGEFITKAPGQHLPSLLRTGTGCNPGSSSISQGTLRLFRTTASFHPA